MTQYFVITPFGVIKELAEMPAGVPSCEYGDKSLYVSWNTRHFNIEGDTITHTLSISQVKALQLLCRRFCERIERKANAKLNEY